MPKGPTSKDVAKLAQVSQSTVSYVMSGKRAISEETRRRVEAAIAQLTYQPHAGARALAGQRSNAIAVIMPFTSPGSAQKLMAFVEEITVAARRRDYDVLLVTADEGSDGIRRVVGRSLCDAVLVMEVGAHDERADAVRELSLPVIFIGVPEDSSQLHCVDFDFEEAGGLLVDELADLDHRVIDILCWDSARSGPEFNYVPRFARGVERAARKRGVQVRTHEPAAYRDMKDFVQELFQCSEHRPGLVLTTSITETMQEVQRQDLRPGRDLDVLLLSSLPQEESWGLTTVSTQQREVARQVMRRLFALVDGEIATPTVELIPARVDEAPSVADATS